MLSCASCYMHVKSVIELLTIFQYEPVTLCSLVKILRYSFELVLKTGRVKTRNEKHSLKSHPHGLAVSSNSPFKDTCILALCIIHIIISLRAKHLTYLLLPNHRHKFTPWRGDTLCFNRSLLFGHDACHMSLYVSTDTLFFIWK